MRRDAQKLFEKLNRRDFHYREFEDAFPDMELWPIFELVLKDRRIVGEDAVALSAQQRQAQAVLQKPAAEAPAPTVSPLFERYHKASATPTAPTGAASVDLRDFFGRFSETN